MLICDISKGNNTNDIGILLLIYEIYPKEIIKLMFLPIWEIYPKEISRQNVPKFDRSHFCPMRVVPHTPTLRIPLKLQSKPRVLVFFDKNYGS